MATTLALGDIALVGVGADTGVKSFAFVVLVPVEEGTVIYFTDNGWLAAGGFRAGEGVYTYTVPAGGLAAGAVITISGLTGSLNPSASGDQIIVYQGSAATPTLLFAIDFADGNATYAGDATNSNTSAVPTGLTFGDNALAFGADNVGYTGPTTGTRAEILAAIADESNWTENDTAAVPYPTGFTVNAAGTSTVSIDDVSIIEGDAGTSIITFTVTRTNNTGAFSVDYATADGTATTADGDYVAASGTVTFTAGGSLTQTISVTVNGDLTIEGDEGFVVNLSNVVNTTESASIADGQGAGTITNDDFPPTVSISDAVIAEGDNGAVSLTFTVTRTDGNSAFTVDYSTGDGTATTADNDYVAASGTLTFTAGGALSQTVTVIVNGDTVAEGDETLTVTLSNVVNSVGGTAISDGAGIGTVYNDDGLLKIYDIQGAGHTSPYAGQAVVTIGIVTAIDKDNNAYWIQDANGDGDVATSDGVYVYIGGVNTVPADIQVGAMVRVGGTVSEFVAQAGDLSLTEITSVSQQTVLSLNNPLPAAVIIGNLANGADRAPPLVNLGDSAATGVFDPANDGIDFWESVEGMRVTLQNVHTVSPLRTAFGEVMVTMDVGANPSLNSRGGLTISDESPNGTLPADKVFDFNPERIQLDDEALGGSVGTITSVGQTVVGGDVTGVVGYGFGFYDVNVTQNVVFDASTLVRETTTIEENFDRIRISTFNVQNLAPLGINGGDGVTTQAKLDAIADAIIQNLKAPDIIGLQELQDASGVSNNGVVDASLTITQIINTIIARGGPHYQAIISDPVNGTEGGVSGGNIQVAYLYNPDVVTPTADNNLTAAGASYPDVYKFPTADRIGTGDSDFAATRKSLPIEWSPAGYTSELGGTFYTINNHLSSKGGSATLMGSNLNHEFYDDTLNSPATKREGQAEAIKAFIDSILADGDATNDKIVALGDFNDFQFFPVVEIITGEIQRTASSATGSTFISGQQILKALIETLPPEERYSYSFDGNAQALDQILATLNLLKGAIYDIVHINSEFSTQLSDHDPTLVSLVFVRSAAIATEGADLFTQAAYTAKFGAVRGSMAGDDIIYALGGDDLIDGSAGSDLIDGGGGFDTVDYTGSNAAVTVNLTTRTASGGWAEGDTLISIENVTGSAFDDFLTGSATKNILNGGLGADTMSGGGGNDTYYVDNLGDVVIDTSGVDTVIASISYVLLAGFENLTLLDGAGDINGTGNAARNILIGNDGANILSGGDSNDSLYGGAGIDTLDGGEGNDILDGGLGADHMIGGNGSDIYYVDDAGDTITETLNGGYEIVHSTAASYTLSDYLEKLILDGAFDQDGAGNAQGNIIIGNAFANVLSGGDGNDTLDGGDGDDTLNGGADTDRLYGGAGSDILNGGAGSDILDGGTGADQMAGGDGNDTYYVDDAGDVIIELAGEGIGDRVFTTVNLTLSAATEIESIYVVGGAGLTITGSDTNNKIYGGDGNDVFSGAGGNDYLAGGDGDDVLNGGDGNDYLIGGAGADTMAGGDGSDTYLVDEFDTVIELADGGIDTIRTDLTYILGANFENLILTSGGAQDGTGNDVNNTLTGNAFANTLRGLGGADRLVGNEGDDILDGGDGNDTLLGGDGDDRMIGGLGVDRFTGGTGRDTFVTGDALVAVTAGQAAETDYILDYEAGEVIELATSALHFQAVFNGTAGQAKLIYTAATDSTLFQLDINGDNRVDYQIRFTGNMTETHIITGGDAPGTGGWLLTG